MKKIGECVPDVVFSLNKGEVSRFYKVFRNWEVIAGEPFHRFSRVKDLVKGSAIIEVDHSAGMNLIQMEKAKLLKKLQAAYPELFIENIGFVLKKEREFEQEIHFMPQIEVEKNDVEDENSFREMMDHFKNLGE